MNPIRWGENGVSARAAYDPNEERLGERDRGRGEPRREMRGREGMGRMREERTGRGRRWRSGAICVRDIMTRNPKCASPNDSVQRLAEIMVQEDTGIVPIVEGERLLGVVTDRDIVARIVAHGLDMRSARARDVMTDDVECVTEQDSLHDVLRLMAEHQVRRVPVVARGDRLLGIVSMADIAREADVDEELQDTFEEISSERSFWSRLR